MVTADSTPMSLLGVGLIVLPSVSLFDVYYIPSLTLNLVSVSQLCQSGYLIFFSSSNCSIHDLRSQQMIGIGRREGGLYVLDQLKVSNVTTSSVDLSSFHLSPSSSAFYL